MYEGDAVMLSLRGSEGDLAVMAGHIPLVTGVQAGECRILLEDDSEREGDIDNGLLVVASDAVTLIVGSFEWIEE